MFTVLGHVTPVTRHRLDDVLEERRFISRPRPRDRRFGVAGSAAPRAPRAPAKWSVGCGTQDRVSPGSSSAASVEHRLRPAAPAPCSARSVAPPAPARQELPRSCPRCCPGVSTCDCRVAVIAGTYDASAALGPTSLRNVRSSGKWFRRDRSIRMSTGPKRQEIVPAAASIVSVRHSCRHRAGRHEQVHREVLAQPPAHPVGGLVLRFGVGHRGSARSIPPARSRIAAEQVPADVRQAAPEVILNAQSAAPHGGRSGTLHASEYCSVAAPGGKLLTSPARGSETGGVVHGTPARR